MNDGYIIEKEIARQYILVTEPDVILGGGKSKFKSSTPDGCGTSGDFIAQAEKKGYRVAYTKDEMEAAVRDKAKKLLGLFNASSMIPEYLRPPVTSEPRLPEMTAAALQILAEDKDGFFLLVEGSQVDWGNHDNNLPYQLGEMLAFDEAGSVVLDWIGENPERENHTLLIVLSDHETGGFAINGPWELLNAGETVDAGWTTSNHTGVDTLIWSEGPGSEALGKAIDNTDLYGIMKEAME